MKMTRFNKLLLISGLISFMFVQAKCKDPEPDPPVDTPATYTCTSNITDGCFDDWKVFSTTTGDYIEPMGLYLQTLNELSSLPPEAGGPGPVTADTVTDCTQGKYAVRITSKIFHLTASIDIFIPGYVGASVLDIPKQTIHLGKPYSQRPQKLLGSYKYTPVGSDSAEIQVMLTKWNTTLLKRDTISYDKIILKNAVPTYTPIDRTLTYKDATATPDTLVLIFAASAGIDFNSLQGCNGQEGSVMWVDDVKFQMP